MRAVAAAVARALIKLHDQSYFGLLLPVMSLLIRAAGTRVYKQGKSDLVGLVMALSILFIQFCAERIN